MAGAAPLAAGDGWEPTLAAALLGAERAPPHAAAHAAGPLADLVAERDPGGALLARLAAQGVHHLAGAGLGPEALAPAEPRPAIGPECPPAVAARLHGLLVGGPAARARLAEWCELAAAAGLRAPAWLLPALIPHRAALRGAIDPIAGPELDWLARACGDAPAEVAEGHDWTEGTVPEHRAAFSAFRRRDPAGALAALEPGFRKERAELREAMVHALEEGLSQADEPFLDACLDDRAGGVRDAARRLLPGLPGSRYAARMAERARAALRIEGKRRLLGGTAHTLVVTLPEESPDLARDGVEPNSWESHSGGTRAGLLRAILARAPLHAFSDHPPRLWMELALRGEWAEPVFNGLFSAILRTRDPDWIRAAAGLLADAYAEKVSGVRRTNQLLGLWGQAVGLLPDAEWEERVGAQIRARRIEVVPALLGHGPERFSEAFGTSLLDWLALVTRGSEALRRDLAKTWVIERLGERLPPGEDAAAKAAAILARLPDGDDRLRPQLAAMVETLELRTAMRRDFRSATDTGPP